MVAGRAAGQVLTLTEPLSFWGGVDATGEIVDVHHPQAGANVAGRVLVMTTGRGSSSSSSVLAELIRSDVGPAAILLGERDPIIALGALAAQTLYGRTVPVVVLDPGAYAQATAAQDAKILPSGEIELGGA